MVVGKPARSILKTSIVALLWAAMLPAAHNLAIAETAKPAGSLKSALVDSEVVNDLDGVNRALPAEIREHFYFAGLKDAKKREIRATEEQLKDWKKQELKRVTDGLVEVAREQPGLFKGASTNGKIALLRVAPRPKRLSPIRPLATTFACAISFDDRLFKSSYSVKRVLFHELVHVNDSGGRISHSKEWVDFAQKTIVEMRYEARFVGRRSHMPTKYWTSDGLENCIGSVGAKNLKESLAEYFANRFTGHFKSELPESIRVCEKALLDPSESDIRFRRHYRAGDVAQRIGDHQVGKEQFEAAREVDINVAAAAIGLAHCMSGLGHASLSRALAEDAVRLMEGVGISSDEETLLYAQSGLAFVEYKSGEMDRATALLDTILWNEPSNAYALTVRGRCHSKAKHSALTAFDYYNAVSTPKLMNYPIVTCELPEIAMDRYNQAVLDESNRGRKLLQRGLFAEYLGDREKRPVLQELLYQAAAKDYRASFKYDDASVVDGLFGKARVSIKLGDLEQAESDREDLMKVAPNPIPPKIIDLLLLEAKGKREEAALDCAKIMHTLHSLADSTKNAKSDEDKNFYD